MDDQPETQLFAVRSRKAIMSRNFQVVSTCRRGRGAAGRERLPREVEKDRGVLADRVEEDRIAGLCRRLAKDVDALGFERRERVEDLRGQAGSRPGSVEPVSPGSEPPFPE